MKVTEAQLKRRVVLWQKRLTSLGIGHWRVEKVEIVEETISGPTANATTGISNYYDNVWFEFTRSFLEDSDEQRVDEVIIHEWLHVSMRGLDAVLEAVEGWMPPATYNDFQSSVEREVEKIVERTARGLYESYVVQS